jgi:hypothetical protein
LSQKITILIAAKACVKNFKLHNDNTVYTKLISLSKLIKQLTSNQPSPLSGSKQLKAPAEVKKQKVRSFAMASEAAALCPYQALREGVSDADVAGALVWGWEKVSVSVILATQLEILLKNHTKTKF